jgi:hypothetical protein
VSACAECGFDGAGVSPADAVAALRSFPRRFRELLEPGNDDMPPPGPAERQAVLRLAASAAAMIAARGRDLHRVLVEEQPGLTAAPATADAEGGGDALERLQAVTDDLASAAAATKGDEWRRTGQRDGSAVTAIDVLREAVHAAAHQLRAAAAIVGRR